MKSRRQFSLYEPSLDTGALAPLSEPGPWLDDAAAYYQTASWLFKSGGLRR